MALVAQRFGDAALRVQLPEGVDGRAVLEALRVVTNVVDALVTEHHALVTFDPSAPAEADAVCSAVDRALRSSPVPAAERLHSILVRYDGADLEGVARAVGASRDEVIVLHAAPVYVVASIGFQPGFAYLRGLPPRLVIPRRASPRTRVPALSVAVAGPYTGVYPFASPGGWHILGTALDFQPFDAARGAALALGDRVKFVPEGA